MLKKGMSQHFPGLRQVELNHCARYIARNIHARFYGANVDGVESPLWRKDEPEVEASELLKQIANESDLSKNNPDKKPSKQLETESIKDEKTKSLV